MPMSGRRELGAVRAYAAYLFNAAAKWSVGLAVVVPLSVIPSYLFTYFFSISDLLRMLLVFTGMGYYLVSIIAVYSFALDLAQGSSVVFLSQPLTRRGYVLAWMLASVALPALAYALSFVIPFLILDATMLVSSDPQDFILLFLEGFTISMATFFAALSTKRPALVVALGLFLHILLYFALALVFTVAYHWSLADEASLLFCFLYPFRSKLSIGTHPEVSVYLNALTAAALVLISLKYAEKMLEVAA